MADGPKKTGEAERPLTHKFGGRFRLVLWISLWAVSYAAAILVYNKTYDFTRTVLLYNLQVRPATWILQHTLTELPISCSESSIFGPGIQVQILRGCDGVEAWLLIVTALLTYPMSWRRRGRSLLFGTLLVFSVNLIRIVSLFHIAVHHPAWMNIAHGLIWQSLMVLVAFVFVLYWMEPEGRDTKGVAA